MDKIQVLDCTLRDGGYCNDCKFGSSNMHRIIGGLMDANIDIIECGFLSHKITYQQGVSRFSSAEQINSFIPVEKKGKKFVVLANYGDIDIDKLEPRSQNGIDGIRVAFHKKDLENAIVLCGKIKEKGYEVFIQAMVSLSYTDVEFLSLINKVNKLNPYAFYIVDSFGVMKQNDLARLFYLVDNNLNSNIILGYHAHNNLQLAHSNARFFVEINTSRDLVIDTSVMGMGRGAGNLNTEIFIEYLNNIKNKQYVLQPILLLIDGLIDKFYQKNSWGYSLPNYLSAKHNIHPNYAKYLSDKHTLTVAEMDTIFNSIDKDKQINFDRKHIEEIYLSFMRHGKVNEERLHELKDKFNGKKILLIAPGRNSEVYREKINAFMEQHDVVSISVNFDYNGKTNYVFVSNIRRFSELSGDLNKKVILTSNIATDKFFVKANYMDLINDEEKVFDNAGLMLIKLLINLGIQEVYLAGFDGYNYVNEQNYAKASMELSYKKENFEEINNGMQKVLNQYGSKIRINYFTNSRFMLI